MKTVGSLSSYLEGLIRTTYRISLVLLDKKEGSATTQPFMFCKQFSQVCTSNLIFAASSNCQLDNDSFLVLLDDISRKLSLTLSAMLHVFKQCHRKLSMPS